MTRLAFATLVATFVAACAGEAQNLQPTPDDPSSPQAPEARVAPPSRALADRARPPRTLEAPGPVPAPESTHSQEAAHQHGPAHGTVYTCPMHPDVSEPGPGQCPRCGMTLVPRKGGATSDGARP